MHLVVEHLPSKCKALNSDPGTVCVCVHVYKYIILNI
jgi:hypothetical protein